MKIPRFSVANSTVLIALLALAPCALASMVDQSQLNANIALPFDANSFSIGQSFQAGISGLLTNIDIFSNGQVLGGNNALVLDLYSGSGIGGQFPLLGSLSTSVSSIWNSTLNGWLIDINTQGLNTSVVAGQEYTFAISQVTGSGDLNSRGLLSSAVNPYQTGKAFSPSIGNQLNWDLEFQTRVNAVPIPTMFWLSATGFIGVSRLFRKSKAA